MNGCVFNDKLDISLQLLVSIKLIIKHKKNE